MILDLFAGPGGWDLGARWLGLETVGIELDKDACATRAAAGFPTIRASVPEVPLDHMAPVEGLIASPPCTAFSQAGKRKGIDAMLPLLAAVEARDWGARPDPDPAVWLVLEVGRYVEALSPRWIACEQVPPVLPIWEMYATWLAQLGYSVWAGVTTSEQYGVPQTRKRALLLASLDRASDAPPPRTSGTTRGRATADATACSSRGCRWPRPSGGPGGPGSRGGTTEQRPRVRPAPHLEATVSATCGGRMRRRSE